MNAKMIGRVAEHIEAALRAFPSEPPSKEPYQDLPKEAVTEFTREPWEKDLADRVNADTEIPMDYATLLEKNEGIMDILINYLDQELHPQNYENL